MAIYIDVRRVHKSKAGAAFSAKHKPGSTVPYSGIYRCANCESEIAANANDPFPPQNHAQHPKHEGSIEWILLVASEYD